MCGKRFRNIGRLLIWNSFQKAARLNRKFQSLSRSIGFIICNPELTVLLRGESAVMQAVPPGVITGNVPSHADHADHGPAICSRRDFDNPPPYVHILHNSCSKPTKKRYVVVLEDSKPILHQSSTVMLQHLHIINTGPTSSSYCNRDLPQLARHPATISRHSEQAFRTSSLQAPPLSRLGDNYIDI